MAESLTIVQSLLIDDFLKSIELEIGGVLIFVLSFVLISWIKSLSLGYA